MDKAIIPRGATIWARQTIDSEIFRHKPAMWFKIWFYLINRVSHKDTKKYNRGETYLQQAWIKEFTGASDNQIKRALQWFRKANMIETRRSTRGTWIKILNYSHYQRLDNYYSDIEAPNIRDYTHETRTDDAPRYNKNEKNENNTLTSDSKESSVDTTLLGNKHDKNDKSVNKERIDEVVASYKRRYLTITGKQGMVDKADRIRVANILKEVPMQAVMDMIIWYMRDDNEKFFKHPNLKSIYTTENFNKFRLTK